MAPGLPTPDSCVIRLPLKSASDASSPFRSSVLDALGITSNDGPGLKAFFERLQEERSSLLKLLEHEDATEEDVDRALTLYLSLLNHLLVPTEAQGTAPLRNGFSFVWNDVLVTHRTVVVKTVEHEMVNVMLTTALWKIHQGAAQLVYTESGLSTSAAAKAFLLYRKAIGLTEYSERLIGNRANAVGYAERTDADVTVLTAVKHLLYAEIQGITVLRAIEKGNAPSLISSLAMDAQQRYDQSRESSATHNAPGSFLKKIFAYTSYKATCFHSYALTYYAWAKLSGSAGGAAVRLANEAETVFQKANDLGTTYDKIHPPSNSSERNTYHKALQQAVIKVKKQAESDNRHVYYDRVPVDLPELPAPKQLLGSIAYEFPDPSDTVSRDIFVGLKTSAVMEAAPETVIEVVPGTSQSARPQVDGVEQGPEDKTKTATKPSRWWRWLLLIIAIPLLAVITFVGFGVWIILIPFKIFCWPAGMLAQWLWYAVEYLIKAPLRAMKWAAGDEWRPTPPANAAATSAQS